MLYYRDLENLLLANEKFNSATHLIIISGFVGWEPLEKLLEKFSNMKVTLIYGMYAQYKVSNLLHNALLDIAEKYKENLDILYSLAPVHSKIYFWKHDEAMLGGYIGSANFSASGLSIDFKETLEDIEKESFDTWKNYYNYIKDNCISITDNKVKKTKVKQATNLDLDFEELVSQHICRVSLLIKKNGELIAPPKSGINWGYQKGHASKEKTDAYIPIRPIYRKEFPNMFPEKKLLNITSEEHTGKVTRHEEEFEVIWDDGTKMLCIMEGNNKTNNILYPKQISSSPSKKILGLYIRERMQLPPQHFITKEDLVKYGRTHIDIQLLDDGTYFFDFSVNKY